jgi:hypothetical protein
VRSQSDLALEVPSMIKEHQAESLFFAGKKGEEDMAVVQSSATSTMKKSARAGSVAMLPVVSRLLRPKQVRAATLLVMGQQGKDVASTLGVALETLSGWKQRPEFEALMRGTASGHDRFGPLRPRLAVRRIDRAPARLGAILRRRDGLESS